MSTSVKDNLYKTTMMAQREQRILDHLPLVKRIAWGFSARLPASVDPADLVSAGTLGLIRAVDGFDRDRGVEFRLFAVRRIRETILDYLREQDPLPYSTRVKLRRVENTIMKLERTLKRLPTEQELAKASGLSREEVSTLLAEAGALALYSLDEERDEGEGTSAKRGDASPDVLTRIERKEMREVLARLIRGLPRAERLVLSLYYYEGLKMREIGNLLGITESRVSQVHTRAVTALRGHLRELLEGRE